MVPIKKLQVATKNIKEGNLDFTIDYDEPDEMGDLCRNFEDMRKRLKESTEEKMAAEKENRALISNIAHDLKTPITAVKGYSEGEYRALAKQMYMICGGVLPENAKSDMTKKKDTAEVQSGYEKNEAVSQKNQSENTVDTVVQEEN